MTAANPAVCDVRFTSIQMEAVLERPGHSRGMGVLPQSSAVLLSFWVLFSIESSLRSGR